MGLFPNAIAWPRNGMLEGMYGGYFCKGNKSVNNLYGLNIYCLIFCYRLTYRVFVAGLTEPQLGNVSQEEGDKGGSQKHGGQVLVHFIHRVAEQSAAHLIQMHGHFSAFTFFWILPGSCKWLKTLTATRRQWLPVIWCSCSGDRTWYSLDTSTCQHRPYRSPAPAWPCDAPYWLSAGCPSSIRSCDWLPVPEPMSGYMMSPQLRVRDRSCVTVKLVLDCLGGHSLWTQKRIRDAHR